MSPAALDQRFSLFVGDVFDGLEQIESDTVDCVVTSPPYWGLRNYGVTGQMGLEPTLDEHLEVMVRVFQAVRRVLKPTGTLWVNYGDCYATTPNGRAAAAIEGDDRTFRDKPFSTVGGVLKPKDLCLIPSRLAIRLQEDGWWVRSEIIWGKPNPMPDSSGAYRPSTAHEKIYLLAKSDRGDCWRARDTGELSFTPDLAERVPHPNPEKADATLARWIRNGVYYDAHAVKVEAIGPGGRPLPSGYGVGDEPRSAREFHTAEEKTKRDKQRGHSRRHAGFNDRWDQMSKQEQSANGRYLRNYEPAPPSVWEFATRPYPGGHFATFPPELVERCLKAGCPEGGLVLDPFGGVGTTALVALRLGRRAHLIELNPEYAAEARARIARDWRLAPPALQSADAGPLFAGVF